MEPAVPLDLAFQAIEQVALKLSDLAAAQAGHVDVIALRPAFVVMLFSLQMHQIQLVHQAVSLEQVERPVDRNPVNLGIKLATLAQCLARIQMLLYGLPHAENGAALVCHAKPSRH